MKRTGRCPKCESSSIARREYKVEHPDPDARDHFLCADCGYEESYLRYPKRFLEDWGESPNGRVVWLGPPPPAVYR